MTNTDPKKEAVETKEVADTAKEKPTNPAVTKAAGGVFATIKAKVPIDSKKVDDWQKKWLALPEHRTKYGHLKDVPDVVGEELFAMANDIIDFCQRQPGGQSHVFKSIKENFGSFLKHPAEFLRKKAEEDKKKAMEAKEMAVKKAEEETKKAEETKEKVAETKKTVQEKATEAKESVEKKADETKKIVEEKTAEIPGAKAPTPKKAVSKPKAATRAKAKPKAKK